MKNIHATCISYKNKGILLLGKPGAGKSDLALRMIMREKAKLVADDRTEISVSKGNIYASAPENIQGLMEVRGIGIKKFPFRKRQKLYLAVKLDSKMDRMPEKESFTLESIEIPQVTLNPFEASVREKLMLLIGE